MLFRSLQRMSGIATAARRMSALFAGTRTRLVDTRKTCPNMRGMDDVNQAKEDDHLDGQGDEREKTAEYATSAHIQPYIYSRHPES